MSELNLDKFIDGLSEGLEPVKPLAHPVLRVLPFFALAIGYVALLVYFVGLRGDINERFMDPSWMIETFMMGFVALSAGIASSYLAVPDMRGSQWVIAPPLTALLMFVAWTIFRVIAEGTEMPTMHLDHCMGEGLFMAAIPMTMLVFLIRRGATTHPRLTTFMNLLAACALGYIGLRFTCTMDTVTHVTVSHLVPYITIGALLSLGAKKLYKW